MAAVNRLIKNLLFISIYRGVRVLMLGTLGRGGAFPNIAALEGRNKGSKEVYRIGGSVWESNPPSTTKAAELRF